MPPKKPISSSNLAEKDLVLAKMPRYPQWPAFIMPESLIPAAVKKAKKKLTNFCVIFIPDGDFYWMTEKSLEPLTEAKLAAQLEKVPEQFKTNPKKKKSGKPSNVNEAFVATDGLDFDTFINNIFNEEEEDEEEEDEEEDVEEDEEAESQDIKQEEDEEDEDDEEEDEEEEENDEEGEESSRLDNATNNTKHRIRARKSSTTGLRNGKRTAKQEDGNATKRAKKESVSNGNGNGKSDAKKEETPKPNSRSLKLKPDIKPLTEEEKQHQLWLCRIKLQRSLIQRNQPVTPKDTTGLKPPTADELSVARLILYRLGDFPVSVELLKKTKIHKVLKCILRDEALAYPDSFKLHERCHELLDKWDHIVQSIKLEKSANSYPDNEQGKLSSGHVTQEESEISALNNSIIGNTENGDKADPVRLKTDITSV